MALSPRPWDIRELHAGDARRLSANTDRSTRVEWTEVRHLDIPATRPAPTVTISIPVDKPGMDDLFRDAPRWTREFIRQMARLGCTVAGITSERLYLSEVGRKGLTLVVDIAGDYPIEIIRVTVGRKSLTARQATMWLRKQGA